MGATPTKATVENLGPNRIRLTVEIPYEELRPSLSTAYKEIGSQIQTPGLRRDHVPNRVIDQRVDHGTVIQEAVNNRFSDFYRSAITEAEWVPILQPEVDVAELPSATGENGGQPASTTEVTIRLIIKLPGLSKAELTVDAVEVINEGVDTELNNLCTRFGSLKSMGRKAKTGDLVTIDLKAAIDGGEVGSILDVSYKIGKGNIPKGLDTALRGLKTDESATFTTELAGGEHAGEQAEVTVAATAVKQRELPKVDDEFARLASEFNTVEKLREDLVKQVTEHKTGEQAVAARSALLEHLRSKVAFSIPEAVVEAEVAQHLRVEDKNGDGEHAKEIRENIVNGVHDQIILDVLAEGLKVGVARDELLEFLFQTAQQYDMELTQFLQGAQQAGQIPAFVSEVARNKSLAMTLRQAAVVDSEGETVDLFVLIGSDESDTAMTAQAAVVAAEGEDTE